MNKWLAAVGDKPFHGGAVPSTADVSVFGVLRSVHDYDVFSDMLRNTSLAGWYDRMAAAVGEPSART